jgi:hypothetical protein
MHRSLTLDPLLSKMNSTHTIISSFFKMHFILSSYLELEAQVELVFCAKVTE